MVEALTGRRLQQFRFCAADDLERLADAGTILPLWLLGSVAAARRQLAGAAPAEREGLRQVVQMLERQLAEAGNDVRGAFTALCDHAERLEKLADEYLGPRSPHPLPQGERGSLSGSGDSRQSPHLPSLPQGEVPYGIRSGGLRGEEAPAADLMGFLHALDAQHTLAMELEETPGQGWLEEWQLNAARVAGLKQRLAPPGKLEAAVAACRALLDRPDGQLPGPPEPRYRWRVSPQDHPEQTVAELVFEGGRLTVNAEDKDLQALIQYFLLDPENTHPLFFRDTRATPGPHTRTFGQIDRTLLDFNRRYPQWRAERAE